MSASRTKGWCPGALRPMQSGDGLVVRVRPHAGSLTSEQALGIAKAAARFGNGLIDLTSRANLQIRGVSADGLEQLLPALAALDLLDLDEHAESERNILVAPLFADGDDTLPIAHELERELAGARLGLPSKFGFAVDCGTTRLLAAAPADIRIERDDAGALLVRADGADLGHRVTRQECVPFALALARWFACTREATHSRRMAALVHSGIAVPLALPGEIRPVATANLPSPGLCKRGALVSIAFGQLTAPALSELASLKRTLRMTPWRMMLIEGLDELPDNEDFITDPDDPLLRVVACTGAPGCPQAHAPTRPTARALAPIVPKDSLLHVSGCPKGCAHPGRAPLTLVACAAGFDFIRNGSPGDLPILKALPAESIPPAIAGQAGVH